jgi:hypothetical protein
MLRAGARAWPLALAAAAWTPLACAGVLGEAARQTVTDYCSTQHRLDARQQDRLLRFADLLERELEASGVGLAIVSRSGMNLQRFGQRYSHAGISLRQGAELPWAVRQLYYACDEKRPRIFDQGLAGFVMGNDDPGRGFVSVVLLPAGEAAAKLERTALDRPRALGLLAERYSANAYPFSPRYQNCNQWLAELLATAWADLDAGAGLREQAQSWLRGSGYRAQEIAVGSQLTLWLAGLVPLLHLDDHPPEDRAALRLRVSMPEGIETFVRERWPQSRRIELCHAEGRVVVRHGWEALDADCVARAGDRLIELD